MSNETVTVNRKYKDTVFRKLYSDMRKCMELYNALHGTNYTNAEEFEIVTLENAIYMSKKNAEHYMNTCFLLNGFVRIGKRIIH